MANITKRQSKTGDVSYLIRVFVEQDTNGKQTTKSMTWKPPAGMRPTAADKQAEKEAVLFEQQIKSGTVSLSGKTCFADYSAQWLEASQLAPKTRDQYVYLLQRINKAIGHIPLEKLRVEHIQKFIKNLREDGIRDTGKYAVSDNIEMHRNAAGLTKKRLSELAGVSISTVTAAAQGKHVSCDSANKLSAALDMNTQDLFTISSVSDKLSDRTIWHYYKLIRAILTNAKKTRILPHNVTEYMEAPKLPRDEVKYLNDEEASRFLSALIEEPDIRVKTALILDLFTGLRRGELCGLSWADVDIPCNTIHVRRASQYIAGHGVIEVPTKTRSSERSISVTPFVTDVLKEYKRWWIDCRFKYGQSWKGDKDRLFIQSDGKPIFPDTINEWLSKFTQRNNFPHITPHSLRHTFVTLQITAGVDIRTLQARSGHAQASTLLNIYSHAIQSAQDKAAQAMDDLLLGSKKHPGKKRESGA